MKVNAIFGAILALTSLSSPPPASFAGTEDNELKEVKKQIEILTEEVERLKLGEAAGPSYGGFTGLGPAASKVYSLSKGLSIGGYGEAIYSGYLDSSKKDLADTFRFVLYGGYKYSDKIVMNAELEYEHTSDVSVEFMYLDFLAHPLFNLRTGLVLVPIGFINELHEPTVYNGALRPEVERNLIPTTWRDLGVMGHGRFKNLSYKVALLNGLRSDKFAKKDWIRGGRFSGRNANAGLPAFLLNLDYEPVGGLAVGGAYYIGKAGEGLGGDQTAAGEKDATVNLWEAHADYRLKGLGLRALYAKGSLSGNSAFESSPPGDVGKSAEGWYVEGSYDIARLILKGPDSSITPFIRYEDYNTHKEVFTGAPDPVQHRKITTIGVGYKPIQNVVIKADYQIRDTASGLPEGKGAGLDENKIDQVNLGIGFIF